MVESNGYIACGGNKGYIYILDNGTIINTIVAHTGILKALVVLNNGFIVSVGYTPDTTVKIWNIIDASLVATLYGNSEMYSLYLLQNGNLASKDGYGYLSIWSTTDFSFIKRINLNRLLLVLKNGDCVGTNEYPCNEIRIWNVTESSIKKVIITQSIIYTFEELKNGYLASAHGDATIKIWNVTDGFLKKTLTGHNDMVNELLILNNGFLASGSADAKIKIWNTDTGALFNTLTGHAGPVYILRQLKNGYLASVSTDNKIKIWNPDTAVLISTLEGHTNNINAFLILRSGYFASASSDKSIKIWN